MEWDEKASVELGSDTQNLDALLENTLKYMKLTSVSLGEKPRDGVVDNIDDKAQVAENGNLESENNLKGVEIDRALTNLLKLVLF